MPKQAQAATLIQQGSAYHEEGRLKDAQNIYEEILRIQPNHFDALQLLGALSLQIAEYQKAVECFSKALEINPNDGLFTNQGIALQELQLVEEAITSYDNAIAINPLCLNAHYNRGNILSRLNRTEEAIFSYDNAIAIDANCVMAYNNRGLCFQKTGRLIKSMKDYDKATAIDPDFVMAYNNLGNVLKYLNRPHDAIVSYKKAIAINPGYIKAYYNLSLCQLLIGDFNDGWKGYEYRWKDDEVKNNVGIRNWPEPFWLGNENLKDKTILLYAEQGLGDTIQFCRYVSLVAKLGAKVILEVQPPLVKLLENLEGISEIFGRGDYLPGFDYQCPLLSLPLIFKTDLYSIPPSSNYIRGDKNKISVWQALLGEKTKLRVGLCWSTVDENKSLSLSQVMTYLPCDFEYISLQKEIRAIDLDVLAQCPYIRHFGDALVDFTDTAALCELVDIIICIDTSVAHLAATLVKPTWILLPYCPDWRWLLGRNDSPWYPTAKLYRQEKIGDWGSVLERMKVDLENLHNFN